MEGSIFTIEEFSTFDGPGIRCSIFLKGCPLRCQWCHNPEGQSLYPQVLRAESGCIHCGNCKDTGLTEKSIALCPKHLYRICGERISPEALYKRIENKFWMLNSTGGGITFSGGEPLYQPAFLLECLHLLKGKTHRAVQTSGYAEESLFLSVLKNTDYFLFDLKHLDRKRHLHFTGVENRKILRNYEILAKSGVPFITRIPLIPSVNDTKENMLATAKFMSELNVHHVELLPYNQAAGAKYKSVGKVYLPEFDQSTPPQFHTDVFKSFDIEVKVL